MSRSIKKGPFVAPELLKRVEEMNETGEKKVLKTWSRAPPSSPPSSVTPSPSTTAASTFPFISEDMVGHKLGEFAPPVPSRVTPDQDRNKEGECQNMEAKAYLRYVRISPARSRSSAT